MFLQLFSIEWTRLTRRALFWVTLLACSFFIGLSLWNFYTLNRPDLLDGTLKIPGASFDLANSLDQLILVELPFLVFLAAVMIGNDYSRRTNQLWLLRASRTSTLLSKFAVLALVTFLLQIIALLVGGVTGWYFKSFTFDTYSLANVNWLATIAAAFYMTLVTLPYVAFMFLVTVATRSAFAGIAIGLGYTQFIEMVLKVVFASTGWVRWMFWNLYVSATYLLNSIGNRTVEITPPQLDPTPAFVISAAYTLILLSLAAWLYRRQDLGG